MARPQKEVGAAEEGRKYGGESEKAQKERKGGKKEKMRKGNPVDKKKSQKRESPEKKREVERGRRGSGEQKDAKSDRENFQKKTTKNPQKKNTRPRLKTAPIGESFRELLKRKTLRGGTMSRRMGEGTAKVHPQGSIKKKGSLPLPNKKLDIGKGECEGKDGIPKGGSSRSWKRFQTRSVTTGLQPRKEGPGLKKE